MPLTWYQLGSGPAPWEDATSYSSSAGTAYSTSFSTVNTAGSWTQTARDSSGFSSSISTSAKGPAMGFGSNYGTTEKFSSYGGNDTIFNFPTSGASQSGYGETQATRDFDGSGMFRGITTGSLVQNASASNTVSSSTTASSRSGSTEEYGRTSIMGSLLFVTSSSTVTNRNFGNSNGITGETTGSASYSTTTSFTLATQSYVSSISLGTTTTFRRQSTTRTSSSLLTVSTASTSLTGTAGTDTISYGTTRTSSSSYTRATSSNLSTAGTRFESLTASYQSLTAHLVPVVAGTLGEYLRLVTATGAALVDLSAILGAGFTQSTFSSAASSGVQGSPFTDSTITRTVTSASFTYATITITTAGFTDATVTEADWDGRLPTPASATVERYLSGPTTATATARTGATVTTTATQSGALSFVSYQLLDYTSVSSETITGLLSNGSTTAVGIQRPYSVPVWTTFQAWSGKAGDTVTTYRSPAGVLGFEGGGLDVTRMEREGGFQAPTAMGSAGAQGGGLSANSSFIIDPAALGTASPVGLRTPFLTAESTAVSGASSYTYTLGSNGVWSVTAASTTTSTSFTATVGTASAGEHFNQASPAGVTTNSVTVAGGAHARTGADQHATLNGGHGWRYTVGDGVGTTSSKVILTATYATAALGSSIIAAETFRAGLASPATKTGVMTFYNAAYSAP